jgi:hypothetical protein
MQMTTFVLVREDKSLFQSYNHKTSYMVKGAAERQAAKLGAKYGPMVVMSYDEYCTLGYDKLTRKVRNVMTGQLVEESINTPYSCSVASEAYWSN